MITKSLFTVKTRHLDGVIIFSIFQILSKILTFNQERFRQQLFEWAKFKKKSRMLKKKKLLILDNDFFFFVIL